MSTRYYQIPKDAVRCRVVSGVLYQRVPDRTWRHHLHWMEDNSFWVHPEDAQFREAWERLVEESREECDCRQAFDYMVSDCLFCGGRGWQDGSPPDGLYYLVTEESPRLVHETDESLRIKDGQLCQICGEWLDYRSLASVAFHEHRGISVNVPDSEGSPVIPDDAAGILVLGQKECPACHGGYQNQVEGSIGGNMAECPKCQGAGYIETRKEVMR